MNPRMNASTRPNAPCALVMAGGTGGHIFPGLAVAQALRDAGWRVHWLGGSGSTMESRLIPPQGFAFETIDFAGLRGKGLRALFKLPFNLLRAFAQSLAVLRRVQPDVVIGLGGYISFPAGLMAALTRRPLILHEQNSVAGLANQVLAKVATRVYTAFPNAFIKPPKNTSDTSLSAVDKTASTAPHAAPSGSAQSPQFIGNPLRAAFTQQASPTQRFAGRNGALRLLVVGGSLGAKALNDLLPQALALIPAAQRPQVLHQSGENQIDALRARYASAGVQAELTPFIADTASAFAQADLVIARAGASTVTELAAVGAAALFVPFPFAVDDHQTRNAEYLSRAGENAARERPAGGTLNAEHSKPWNADENAAWLMQQRHLSPAQLATFLQSLTREQLLHKAQAAHQLAKTGAVQTLLDACEQVTGAFMHSKSRHLRAGGHEGRIDMSAEPVQKKPMNPAKQEVNA
jgi:UDP-N-acetylglucosamine--N-acetylmuramyl-(pentapeptide) pyrophosphoryl-undecaprenol N-acetylglucosamine transferase